MIVVENSNIVDWDKYPEFICALVMQTTEDLKTIDGFVCPKGEEITWLLDKSPRIVGDDIFIENAKLNCLGGLGFNGLLSSIDLPADLKEIHYKPKPKMDIKKYKEEFVE
jgi:hypothetical protein